MARKSLQQWRGYCAGTRSGSMMARAIAMSHLVHSIRERVLTRRQYKDTIESHLTGSFLRFTWMKLEALNGTRNPDAAWRREVEEDVEQLLPGWLLHPTKGFRDHRNAALEAVETLKGDDPHNRRTAAERLKREYGLRKIRPLPPDAADEYIGWVQMVIEEGFIQEEHHEARKERL